MIITRQDLLSFRLQTGETIINFEEQPSPPVGLAGPPCPSRASLLELKIGQRRLSMETPGEYEMEGVAIEGVANDGHIFYTIHWDDIIIGLGDPARRGASSGANASYDILLPLVTKPSETIKALVPLCGNTRILIPFGEEKMVAAFLKELDESPEEMDKLTIKKKEIPPEGERKIVVLKPLKK